MKSESDVTCDQVWWPILGFCALQLTHPKCTHTAVNTHTHREHTRSSGQPFMLRLPGSSWGFGALLKGTLVVVFLQFLPTRDSNSQPFDYESDSLTIRPRLPPCLSLLPISPQLQLFLVPFASPQRCILIKIRFPLKDICCPRTITQADTKEALCVLSGRRRYYFSLQRKETGVGSVAERLVCAGATLWDGWMLKHWDLSGREDGLHSW